MALIPTHRNVTDSSIYLINRAAIDSSGRIGSIYDAYQDRLLGHLNIIDQDKLYQSHKLLRCGIVHGNNNRSQNLLRLLKIDEQLRLSILLKLIPGKGIASIIDYPHRTNKYTRLLSYSYVHRIQQLPDRIEDAQQFIESSMPQTKSTHIITSVEWGIDVVIVLQLPTDDETCTNIDHLLRRIYTCLYCNYDTSTLLSDEETLLQKILHTTVYSNIPDLCNMTTLEDVCYYIDKYKTSPTNQPILYQLRPIHWFYPQSIGNNGIFICPSTEFTNNIEQYVFQLTADIKILEKFLNENIPKMLDEHYKEQLTIIQQQWIEVKNNYTIEIDRISKLIIDIRSGRVKKLTINQAFQNHEEITMKKCVYNLKQILLSLEQRSYNSEQKQIQSHHSNYIDDHEYDQILHSNYTVDNYCPVHGYVLVGEYQNNLNSSRSYDELSHHSIRSSTSSLNKRKHKINILNQKQITTTKKKPIPIPSSTDGTINILLLGETGVGKSTFINALVNYHRFKTFKQAQTEPPVALIPVSFVITVNDNLDKRKVKYGDLIKSDNEDFDHPGQSVTQHCKSYVFHLGRGRKIRIIDTPGFGDVRGSNQDTLNMKHILEYIHHFTHINAICFLFKSNALHLHKYFQTCITQLFTLLDENARNNIVFCFTNGRTNFYTPGDTIKLLKNMLKTLSIGEVPFVAENVFCLDNESFRYLVALQNRIPFSDHEKQEYEMSWSTSVTEMNRFIDYISENLHSYQIQNDFQSVQHAQIEVTCMIRPILETMRNILRNIILWNMDSPHKSIELRSKILDYPPIICLSCRIHAEQMGNFWVGSVPLHDIGNECNTCQCSLNQHIQIDYVPEYKFLNNSSVYDRNHMKIMLEQLYHSSAEFSYFLLHIAHSEKDDPFLIGLDKMIAEEVYLSENQKPNYLNLQLVDDLKQLRERYDQRINDITSNPEKHNLSGIYALIHTIRVYPMIREQMIAIKEGRRMMIKQHEYEVSLVQ